MSQQPLQTGALSSGAQKKNIYGDTGDPERVFLAQILRHSGQSATVLDLGCGVGNFTCQIAPSFKEVVGIDNVAEYILQAQQKNCPRTQFYCADETAFSQNYQGQFDLIYSRRGPTLSRDNLLKKGGYYVEIRVADQDTRELQLYFGRGQFYRHQQSSREEIQKRFCSDPFKLTFIQEFFYSECYASAQDLQRLLLVTPIIPDYHPKQDHPRLRQFCQSRQTKAGICLKRHRIVFVAQRLV